MVRKLDSMWYHEMPASGKLASSHIAILFCALAQCGMITNDLLSMEFDGLANDFSDRSLSPMDYCLAYTDGEIFDIYIKVKYRKVIKDLFASNLIYKVLYELDDLEHDQKYELYTIKCNWHNVDVLAVWLNRQFLQSAP
jgi:hypothetical protein